MIIHIKNNDIIIRFLAHLTACTLYFMITNVILFFKFFLKTIEYDYLHFFNSLKLFLLRGRSWSWKSWSGERDARVCAECI